MWILYFRVIWFQSTWQQLNESKSHKNKEVSCPTECALFDWTRPVGQVCCSLNSRVESSRVNEAQDLLESHSSTKRVIFRYGYQLLIDLSINNESISHWFNLKLGWLVIARDVMTTGWQGKDTGLKQWILKDARAVSNISEAEKGRKEAQILKTLACFLSACQRGRRIQVWRVLHQ